MSKCAWCGHTIVLEEFAGRLPDGSLICTACEEGRSLGKDKVGDIIAWAAVVLLAIGAAMVISWMF
jgi:hypothetical protein